MPGKTISAYTDEETAQLVAELARVEHRKPSQIAAEAIALYVRLSTQVHASLRHVRGSSEPGRLDLVLREVSRAIVNASYDLVMDEMAPHMRDLYGGGLQTEEEIDAEAMRLAPSRAPGAQRTRKPGGATRKAADTEARPPRRGAR